MPEPLEKNFNHSQAENALYQSWETNSLFTADPQKPGEPFVIVIPPPNVTGNLHMGHALDNTLQDILIRYHRMKGDNTLWVPGTDHAGIATQAVVERALAQEGVSRESLGRQGFVERVWQWKETYGGNIVNQLRRLGASCDWTRERFTMDEGLSKAVREVFVSLYKEGLIYRGEYIINWCPRCRTAVSDIEVEHEDRHDSLYYINYLSVDGLEPLVVATTRPETLFGDTAVAVNPDDPRFKAYHGRKVKIPIIDRTIPVILDSYVDMEFGTGALKVTPAHDPNDFQIGLRHKLETVKAIDQTGHLTQAAGPYAGQERFEARNNMLAELQDTGLLVKIEPLDHAVGVCYRCRTIIEPLTSKQWFVKTAPLAAEAAEAVRDGRTKLIPSNWEKTYFEWMDNIRDWCISRQLWWGHQIPAWYCNECSKTIVEKTDPGSCPDCGGSLERDPDVLDTWFSSALWPFSTLGWPVKTKDLERYYPTTVLVTGFDIIFFWVARMMMMGLKMMGEVPFKTVVLHPLVRDERGQKMSKSKGNVIDPLELLSVHGADSFRFTLASQAGQARDLKLNSKRVEGYSKFVNKLWNAARFSLSHLKKSRQHLFGAPQSLPDRWILSRLAAVTAQCRAALEEFHFDRYTDLLYQFIWYEFCDWYLELIKPILYGSDEASKESTLAALEQALRDILALTHPVMPFVTEELWSKIPQNDSFLMTSPYPAPRSEDIDQEAERLVGSLMELTRSVRQARSDFGVPPASKLSPIVATSDPLIAELFKAQGPLLLNLMGASKLELADPDMQKPKEAASNILSWGEVWTPLAGHIDPKAESARLSKEADKLAKDIKAAQAKLNNPDYIKKAPPEIVEETAERLETMQTRLEAIERSKALVNALSD